MKSIHCIIAFVILSLAVISCKEKKPIVLEVPPTMETAVTEPAPIAEKDTFLYYHRGACFGMCPIFNLTIYGNGRAVYEGRNFVDRIGFYEARVSESARAEIVGVAEGIVYFEMNEVYDDPRVTDLPATKTVINRNGKPGRVTNRYKGPKSLSVLYSELDSMIEKQSWVPMGK